MMSHYDHKDRPEEFSAPSIYGLGAVSLIEPEEVDQKRLRLSRGNVPSFSERRSAIPFENVAAVSVAVMAEAAMDGGAGRGEPLK